MFMVMLLLAWRISDCTVFTSSSFSARSVENVVTEYVPTDVLGDLCLFRCRSDVVPLDSFRPKWLTTLHSCAGKDPVLVSGVRRFGTPSQKISNHFVVQRHDLFALFCFHRPQVLLPNRLSDVQRLLSEVDVTPLCGKHFTSTHSGGNVE